MGTKLSQDRFEEFICERVRSRLSRILWGENCDTLKEALTFSQEWFFGNVLDISLQPEFSEYIFKEGFCPKIAIVKGKKNTTWSFPFNSKNPNFAKVFAEFQKSLREVELQAAECAEDTIWRFSNSTDQVVTINVQNRIFRRVLVDKLAEYARQLIASKNNRRMVETREYIMYDLTSHGDAMILSKIGNFYSFIQEIESTHRYSFQSVLSSFFIEANRINRQWSYSTRVPQKFVTFTQSCYVQDFKQMLEPRGFEITIMPKYIEKEYFLVGNDPSQGFNNPNNLIPIFIEVPGRFAYSPLVEDNVYLNNYYMEFCRYYW